MKKLRRAIAVLTMAMVFLFSAGPMVHVKADGTGPQGTTETKSGSPSSTSGTLTDQQLAYLLWLLLMWLIWGGM